MFSTLPGTYTYEWMLGDMVTLCLLFQEIFTVFKSDSYAFQFGLAYLTQTDSISIHCGLTHQ